MELLRELLVVAGYVMIFFFFTNKLQEIVVLKVTAIKMSVCHGILLSVPSLFRCYRVQVAECKELESVVGVYQNGFSWRSIYHAGNIFS